MQIALIGWQGSGKSTLFKALTGKDAPFGEQAYPGQTDVPDDRLDKLHEIYPPAKKIYARMDYLDIAGVAHSDEKSGFKRSMINHLQGANVLAPVIGVFHMGEAPAADLAETVMEELADIESEMLLSDLQTAENVAERIKTNKSRSIKIDPIEETAIEKVLEALNEEKPLREIEFLDIEELKIRSYGFLSQKALLVVVNRGEDQNEEELHAALADKVPGINRRLEVMDASIEAEIAGLEEDDRELFLEDLGIERPASQRVMRAGFDMLGLISFFTVGDDEVRAWPIPQGMPSVQAAGTIHSDLERGYIRAEVVASSDLLDLGSLHACKEKGVLRLEGKEYIVKDGDVMHIRFAV